MEMQNQNAAPAEQRSVAEAHQEIEAAGEPPAAAAPAQPAAPAAPAAPAKRAEAEAPPHKGTPKKSKLQELEEKLEFFASQNMELQEMNHKLADALKESQNGKGAAPLRGPSNASAFEQDSIRKAAAQGDDLAGSQIDVATDPRVKHHFKTEQSFMHMVFMAEEAVCYKNVSFEPYKPKFEPMKHKHVVRNVDSKGRRQTETQSQCGHWHPVVFSVDGNGNPVAECLPPIHEVTRIAASGRVVKNVEPIVFEREKPDGTIERIVDDHVHDISYLRSELISRATQKEKLENDRPEAARMGMGFSAEHVKSTAPRPLTPEDGYTLVPGV